MKRIIAEQMELRPALPIVVGNIDYLELERRLVRIDEILNLSGIEERILMEHIFRKRKLFRNPLQL